VFYTHIHKQAKTQAREQKNKSCRLAVRLAQHRLHLVRRRRALAAARPVALLRVKVVLHVILVLEVRDLDQRRAALAAHHGVRARVDVHDVGDRTTLDRLHGAGVLHQRRPHLELLEQVGAPRRIQRRRHDRSRLHDDRGDGHAAQGGDPRLVLAALADGGAHDELLGDVPSAQAGGQHVPRAGEHGHAAHLVRQRREERIAGRLDDAHEVQLLQELIAQEEAPFDQAGIDALLVLVALVLLALAREERIGDLVVDVLDVVQPQQVGRQADGGGLGRGEAQRLLHALHQVLFEVEAADGQPALRRRRRVGRARRVEPPGAVVDLEGQRQQFFDGGVQLRLLALLVHVRRRHGDVGVDRVKLGVLVMHAGRRGAGVAPRLGLRDAADRGRAVDAVGQHVVADERAHVGVDVLLDVADELR